MLSDRHHFTNLEKYILNEYRNQKNCNKPAIKLTQFTTKQVVSNEKCKIDSAKPESKKKARKHSSLLKALKEKEKEICVLNKSASEDDSQDQNNKKQNLDEDTIDQYELNQILQSDITDENISEISDKLSVI